MSKIAVFASGSGTNAENIVKYFLNTSSGEVDCILCNKPDAYVLERAKQYSVDTMVFSREDFYKSQKVLDFLKKRKIDFIVLAGFLWLVPDYLTQNYSKKIVNIHPALLPKYGGKGMYGMKVHEAVVAAKEKESGISIHFVNECYDEGDIIFQATCPVLETDTAEDVAQKIHQLEYEHFPREIEKIIQ